MSPYMAPFEGGETVRGQRNAGMGRRTDTFFRSIDPSFDFRDEHSAPKLPAIVWADFNPRKLEKKF